MILSARAMGILVYVAVSGVPPIVKGLEMAFKEGREALRTAVKELEDCGFVERQNTKIGNRFVKESRVTDAGFRYLTDAGFWARPTEVTRVSGPLLQLSVLNNPIHLYSQVSKESTRESSRDEYMTIKSGEEMPYEFFEKTSSADDDFAAERLKAQKEKKREYQERKAQQHDKQTRRREYLDPSLWTSSDIAYEFAYRLKQHWNIPPWEVVQTRFIPALAEMRKRLDTDGAVEIKMLDMFFESVDFQKYDDPQMLWKMFIKRASELAPQALRLIRTPEQLEQAQVAADKSWDWMED